MVEKIDGRKIAEKIKNEIAAEIFAFQGVRPNLAIILVGSREDSRLYVSLKEREAKKVGIDTHLYELNENVPEAELLEVIKFLNEDNLIDGILIQLPLPEKFNADYIIAAIDPLKDVDGFHPQHPDYIISPVLASITACLKEVKFHAADKQACVLYNSDVFGISVKELLEKEGFKVSLRDDSGQADVLVSALGKPQFIKKEMIKEGAVIIDIGITKVDDKIFGDADYDDIKERASFITPVPGGIGPMTIAFLFKNVLVVHKNRKK